MTNNILYQYSFSTKTEDKNHYYIILVKYYNINCTI